MGIVVSRDGAVALVEIDRQASLNALDIETVSELEARLRELSEDAGVRCVVLTGAGDRAFIGGADLEYMSKVTPEQAREFARGRSRGRAPARDHAEAHDRGRQRLRAGRRLRGRARLRHPLRVVQRQARAARGLVRADPRLGRQPAPRAHDHARVREGADLHRALRGRRGGAAARARRRRRRPRARQGARERPDDRAQQPVRRGGREAALQPRPPGGRTRPTWRRSASASRRCSSATTRARARTAFLEKREPAFAIASIRE